MTRKKNKKDRQKKRPKPSSPVSSPVAVLQLAPSVTDLQTRPAALPLAAEDVGREGQLEPYDEYLLDRARTQWQFGDWDSLRALTLDRLAHHPQRARLALLAAAGQAQCGALEDAAASVRQARVWGADRRQVARVLVSGVYNALGKAAALVGQSERALGHFEQAVVSGTPNDAVRLIAKARVDEQLAQLNVQHRIQASPPAQSPDLLAQLNRHAADLIRLHTRLERLSQSVELVLEHTIPQAPNAVELRTQHAEIAMDREDYREAARRWQDIAGVLGEKTPQAIYKRMSDAYLHIKSFGGTEEENACKGSRDKHDLLAFIHQQLNPGLYLEIGVDKGRSLGLATCPAIGIDPRPQLKLIKPLAENARIIPVSSDEFFRDHADQALTSPPDLVFIDGMHLFEFTLRDFMNVERYSSPTTLVVIDDIYPCNSAQAERRRRTSAWAGDVWKLHAILRRYRQDLFMIGMDAYPTGLLLISGLDANNRVLWDRYTEIVADFADIAEPPESVIVRSDAMFCTDEFIVPLMKLLKRARTEQQDELDWTSFENYNFVR